MDRKIIVMLGFLVIFSGAYGRSDTNTILKQFNANGNANSPKDYQRGTEDKPVFIKEIKPKPTEKDNTEDERKRGNEEETIRLSRATYDLGKKSFWCGTVINAILAAATIGLFVFTYRLWKSTNDMVKNAEKNTKIQLRAYIGFFKTERFQDYVEIWFKNSGSTPASNISNYVRREYLQSSDEKEWGGYRCDISPMTIGSGVDYPVYYDFDGDAKRGDGGPIKLSILIAYDDVFGDRQKEIFHFLGVFRGSVWIFAPIGIG